MEVLILRGALFIAVIIIIRLGFVIKKHRKYNDKLFVQAYAAQLELDKLKKPKE